MKVIDLKHFIESYDDNDNVWIADFDYAEWFELEQEYLEIGEDKPKWSREYLD
jgi:hypothetical protein